MARVAAATLGLLASAGTLAFAQAPKGLLDRGPVVAHPAGGPTAQNPSPLGAGFPAWYRDKNGLTLEPCLAQTSAPAIDAAGFWCFAWVTDPNFFAGNFGGEAFYQSVGLVIPATEDPRIAGGNFVAALEMAYSIGDPLIGDEMVFSRIRVRLPVPDGTYRITHPFGTETIIAQNGTGINFTRDIGAAPGLFDAALAGGDIGPFLVWADETGAPMPYQTAIGVGGQVEHYVGDPNLAHRVTGSPNDTNFFRVEELVGGTWQQVGNDQFLFFLQGKVREGFLARPLSITNATYSRAAVGNNRVGVDVRVSAEPNATPARQLVLGVELPANSGVTAQNIYMTPVADAVGQWWGHLEYDGPAPLNVVVTNLADQNAAHKRVPSDVLVVNNAHYAVDTGLLDVAVLSSDRQNIGVSVDGVAMNPSAASGAFELTLNRAIPPAEVVLTSTGGATLRAHVDIRPTGSDAPTAGATAYDYPVATPEDTAATVDLMGLNAGQQLLAEGWTVQIATTPANGTLTQSGSLITYTPKLNFNGTDTFTYVLINGNLVSNRGTVTVAVSPVNDAPTAAADQVTVSNGRTATLSLTANDTDPDSAILASSLHIIGGLNVTGRTPCLQATGVCQVGSLVLTKLGNGSVTVLGGSTAGTFTLQYTVSDVEGAVSAPGTLRVLVTLPEQLTVSQAQFTRNGTRWSVRAQTSQISATVFNTLTVVNCAVGVDPVTRVVNNCAVIGTVAADATGFFQFAGIAPAPLQTNAQGRPVISVRSSGGGFLNGIVVTIR